MVDLTLTLKILEAVARSFDSQGDSLLTANQAAECVRAASVDTVEMFKDLAKEEDSQ